MVDIEPLTDLTIRLSRGRLSEIEKQRAICFCVQKVVSAADRISLWQFTDDKQAIQCQMMMIDSQFVESPPPLLREHAGPYFTSMLSNELIVASDARHHPDTVCFTENYFKPNHIYSLLDFIFHDNFKPFGIICCERTGSAVQWKDEQIAQLKRVAGVVSMFYAW